MLVRMADDWFPGDDYPGVTLEHVLIVGSIVREAREAREGAAADHRPEKWESNWSLAVRCYERTCGALIWASQEYPWLSIVSGAGGGPVHFVMTIDGHPVRVCRGGPDDLPDNYRQLSFPELLAQQDLFALDNDVPQGCGLRITVENDVNGYPDAIYMVEVNETTGQIANSFPIPTIADSGNVTDFVKPEPPANIPPVLAEPSEAEAQKEEKNKDDKTGSDDE